MLESWQTNEFIKRRTHTSFASHWELNHKCACLRVPMFFLDTIHSPERREWLVGIVYFGFDYYYNYYCGCGYTMKTYHHTINLTAGGSLSEFYSNFKTIVSNIKWQCLKSEEIQENRILEGKRKKYQNIRNKNHRVIPVVFFSVDDDTFEWMDIIHSKMLICLPIK